ncbi:MAG TPA: hypothetical protein PKE06_11010 [Flavilitoribacter sp.]|nr:hypothetical protein [Flavilitoribacter sp.]HMQ88997.1 hypothetical protein [Flavilitoribacter sp.]
MKNMTRITTMLVIALLFFASGGLSAQKAAETQGGISDAVPASISSNFIIRLPEGELSGSYSLDIRNLNFPTAQALDQFCNMFSLDFQTLSGDFANKKITLSLDTEVLARRGFAKKRVDEHFAAIARRMNYYFQTYLK